MYGGLRGPIIMKYEAIAPYYEGSPSGQVRAGWQGATYSERERTFSGGAHRPGRFLKISTVLLL